MVRPEHPSHTLKIISANVRGLRTNIGDLTHNCVLRHSADVVVVTETWLNNEVEPTFGKIRGYTQWNRRDRPERAGGGVAVCFKEGVQAQHLDVVPPPHMEVMFFRVVLADRSAILLCAMYRPPRQGPASLQYFTGALDDLMLEHRCRHVLVVGDLNHHLEKKASLWGASQFRRMQPLESTVTLTIGRQVYAACGLLRSLDDGFDSSSLDEVEVLGVTYDCRLTFKAHIERLARESSGKLASLRRMSWLLDSKGLEVLYKAQVRSSMEYAYLGWGGAANKHLALLDKVQGRAMRLIRDSGAGQEPRLHSLQHRRDVAGLTVMYKVHQQRVPHLHTLRQPLRRAQVEAEREDVAATPGPAEEAEQAQADPGVVLSAIPVEESQSRLYVKACVWESGMDVTSVAEPAPQVNSVRDVINLRRRLLHTDGFGRADPAAPLLTSVQEDEGKSLQLEPEGEAKGMLHAPEQPVTAEDNEWDRPDSEGKAEERHGGASEPLPPPEPAPPKAPERQSPALAAPPKPRREDALRLTVAMIPDHHLLLAGCKKEALRKLQQKYSGVRVTLLPQQGQQATRVKVRGPHSEVKVVVVAIKACLVEGEAEGQRACGGGERWAPF
ncbi:hypothetical protein GWK47_045040 [Chionoecetes opilio]|uniref:Endonuclease/exonuclease/phosphatase domain-containing protein n=1 Tax=Chionoecetes opilio TaxID=41210 RepID=A0A8J4YFA2_CHIOP|nr:hypothetical protein GWK47_045040 [Chionoecetes opilio]